LLDRFATPALETKLVEFALAGLARQPADKLDALRIAAGEPGASVQVSSAFPLDSANRTAVVEALARLTGRVNAVVFDEDPALKAGLRITAGSWVVTANLRDELRFFAGNGDDAF
jgi:F-type H+-transporting ATPase subunit b